MYGLHNGGRVGGRILRISRATLYCNRVSNAYGGRKKRLID